MNKPDKFYINNGILTKYHGKSKDVIVPEGVREIRSVENGCFGGAFSDCNSIQSITLPETIELIDNDAFVNCKNLNCIHFPSKMPIIEGGAFRGCKGLADEKGFIIVGDTLYGYFGKEKEIVIPEGVKRICDGAFSVDDVNGNRSNRIGIKAVTFPNSVESIGEFAFSGCETIKSIFIPENIQAIGDGAFQGCKGMADKDGFVIVRNVLYSYHGQEENVVIPNGITIIGSRAFSIRDGVKIKSIIIPEGITEIGFGAFELYQNDIESITLPSTVKSIGGQAFWNCTSLNHIVLPSGLEQIGYNAFSDCNNLISIDNIMGCEYVSFIGGTVFDKTPWYASLPDGPIYIGKVFYKFKGKLQSNSHVELKPGTVMICDNAFKDCIELESITIPKSVTLICAGAFDGCNSLKKVVIEDIEAWCRIKFEEMDGVYSNPLKNAGTLCIYDEPITELIIPPTISNIRNGAFCGCTSLQSVIIPEGVKTIPDAAFKGCEALERVGLPNSLESIGCFAFLGCHALASIVIPNGVTTIGESAFGGCKALPKITIPESVNYIGRAAFCACTCLKEIVIPPRIKTISDSLVSNCSSLEYLRISEGVCAISEGAFDGCTRLEEILLPTTLRVIESDPWNPVFPTNTVVKQVLADEASIADLVYTGVFCVAIKLMSGKRIVLSVNKKGNNNLSAYGTKEFNWEKYDANMINNGPEFNAEPTMRLYAALYRLLDPEELSDDAKAAYSKMIVKNIKEVIKIAESDSDCNIIRLLFETDAVTDENHKEIKALLAKSTVPEIAEMANN